MVRERKELQWMRSAEIFYSTPFLGDTIQTNMRFKKSVLVIKLETHRQDEADKQMCRTLLYLNSMIVTSNSNSSTTLLFFPVKQWFHLRSILRSPDR